MTNIFDDTIVSSRVSDEVTLKRVGDRWLSLRGAQRDYQKNDGTPAFCCHCFRTPTISVYQDGSYTNYAWAHVCNPGHPIANDRLMKEATWFSSWGRAVANWNMFNCLTQEAFANEINQDLLGLMSAFGIDNVPIEVRCKRDEEGHLFHVTIADEFIGSGSDPFVLIRAWLQTLGSGEMPLWSEKFGGR